MDETSEKYPVCPDRNTPAAFRWFYQPLNVLAFLKARPTPRPAATLVSQPAPGRTVERE